MTPALFLATLVSSGIALYFWAQTVKARRHVRLNDIEVSGYLRKMNDARAELHEMTLDRDWLQGQLNAERHAASQRPVSVVEGVLGRLGGWFG